MERLSDEQLWFWATLQAPFQNTDEQTVSMARELLELRCRVGGDEITNEDLFAYLKILNERLDEVTTKLAAAERVVEITREYNEWPNSKLNEALEAYDKVTSKLSE